MKKFLLNLILLVFLSTFVGFSQIPQVKFLDAASQTANIQTSPNDKNTKPVTYFSVDNNKLLKNKSPKGVLWSDDFSTDKGWTLGGSYWQRGVAIAEPDDDHTATSDGYILACPLGTDYPNNMVREDATSPTIDCSSYSNVQLSFWSFSGCESSSWDHLGLEVYDGSAWQTLFTNGGSFQETSWNQYSWDVSAYADGNANFRFRFYMGSTDGTETYSGWGLDDIELSGDLVGENTITAGSSVEPATISSLIDTEAESFLNFDFTVKDDGSTPATDVLNTLINEIVISQAAGNDIATWSDAIEGATLTDGTTTIYGTVNATDITFSAITNNVGELGYIADNQSKTYTLKIWLKSSLGGTLPTTIDKQNFVFEVTNNSFSLEATSSGFAIGENENSGNTKNEVIVTATQLIFIGQPSSTASSGVALAQQPVIYATDENGNVDTDINSAVTLSNSGTLLITNNSMSFVNGVADFSGSGFMFTTGGEYVTLSATTGALSTISPSTEIAVDIIGCEFFAEDFNLISTKRDLDGEGDWFYTELTNSSNDWGIAARAGNGNCLTIYNNGTAYQYNNGNDGDEIAYYNVQIDATGYRDVTIEFDWQCNGETWYDYGQIMWSTDGTNWSIANQTEFAGQGTWTTGTYDLSVVDGQQFYIAFRWRNDGSVGSNPPFAVDNISIKGIPDFKYNFSYRQDLFEPITGTVVTADGNDGVNISLPAGFDFKYDGVAISNVRANINGWVEMGTSYLANAEINTLNNAGTIPFLAPLWDDLTADAQTRIIYATEGTTPTRVFTIEWLDVLWGGQRQNFQVKLYETSYVIEFWYGIMHSNAAGSASIGINNAGLCMNKQISITPGTTPSASYNVENNSINSTTNLNPGLVYIFNPLSMQSFYTWEAASVAIGQTNFNNRTTTFSQNITVGANNVAISSKGVLAVGAQQNPDNYDLIGRVLIWNTVPETDGEDADVVVGKTTFNDNTVGCTQVLMSNVEGVAFTPDGNRLIASDGGNNRVLIWNSIPTSNGQPADIVLGQPDFVSNASGCSETQFYYPTGITVLPDGRLIIADSGNNRFLIYNSVPNSNNTPADYVIGQSDFITNTTGLGPDKLGFPWYCSYSPDGKLVIGDTENNRVLIFNDVPTSNGASADIVIGQNDFYSNTFGASKTKLYQPVGVTVSVEGKLAVGDFQNSRILMYNHLPAYNGASADYVLGQPNFDQDFVYNDGYSQNDNTSPYLPTNKNMYTVYGISFDLNGRFITSSKYMHRAMLFGATPTETSDLEVAIVSDEPEVCVYNDVMYNVEVINHGPDAAYNVVLNAQLPTGLIHINYDAQNGSTYNQKSGYWRIPFIANGDTARLAFSGEVQPSLAGDNNVIAYANTIASSQKDNDYSNNADNATIAVRDHFAPVITEIPDQFIPRNGNILVNFSVTDGDIGDVLSYTASSSNTALIPINYTNNIIYAGTDINKNVTLVPNIGAYGYSDMEVIVTDTYGCKNEEPFLLTVGNIWEGDDIKNDPTQWDAAENWSFAIPNASLEAIIPTKPIGGNFPIIDINGASCEDLFIEPKASVTINNNYDLSIFGKTYIKSDALGTGSFVDLSVGESKVVNLDSIFVERYLTPDAWHYVTSPISNAPNTVLTQNNCGNYNGNVLDYNETFSTDYDGDGDIDWFDGWEWPWYYTHNSNILTPANGYAYFSFSSCNNTPVFTANNPTFNTGSYNVTVTNQDGTYAPTGFGPHHGWNLVGNPYPSGLDAEDFLTTNAGIIDQTVYFWDESGLSGFNIEGADYASYNPTLGATTGAGAGTITPDKYISISQAFFVHVTSAVATPVSGVINFNNSMRETENSSFFAPVVEVQKLKLSLSYNNLYNELIVGLIDDATFGFDTKYDGYKVEGNQNFAFYSLINTEHFVNQAIPTINNSDQQYSVELGFNAQYTGKYTIDLKYIENISEEISIYLEDKYTDEMINIRQYSSYTFKVDQVGRYDDRFVLHFNKNNNPVIVTPMSDITAVEDEELYIYIPEYYFSDPDPDDVLSYDLTLEDGTNLPSWLNFKDDELLITAFPSNDNVGKYYLKITATDNSGASVSDIFALDILNVNDAPQLINPIADIETNAYEQFTYNIPKNTFIDVDLGDNLRFEATLKNGQPLPNWLMFDASTLTFSGIPSNNDAGELKIKLYAYDTENAFATDIFNIKVNQATNINTPDNDFTIYPNPSTGKFVIDNSNPVYTFTVTDISGKIIYNGTSNTTRKEVNLSSFADGEYVIQILYNDNTSETRTITIQK